jgi:hypothetical protein
MEESCMTLLQYFIATITAAAEHESLSGMNGGSSGLVPWLDFYLRH